MVVDTTLTFAARRNVPVRYNRQLVETTLKTMARVSEIRAKRERQFYKQRMAGNKAKRLADDRKLVEENQHLLPPEERTIKSALYEEEDEDLEDDIALDDVVGNLLDQDIDSDVDMDDEDDQDDSDLESEEEIKKPKKLQNKQKLKMTRGGGLSV
jgi:large subunit ribosomal protein L24e